MKKTIIESSFLFILLISTSFTLCWAEENPIPLKDNFFIGQEITETGKIVLFNGWQPNLRMILGNNTIIGLGKNEEDYESSVPIGIRKYIESENEIEASIVLEYIGSIRIIYYENPLPCFKVKDVLELKVRENSKNSWIIVK